MNGLGQLDSPGINHLRAALSLLRALKVNLSIRYTQNSNRLRNQGHNLSVLYGLSDCSLASCKDTAKSTSLYAKGPVTYYSGWHPPVALSTLAQPIALAKLVVIIKHWCALMNDLQCGQNQDTKIEA